MEIQNSCYEDFLDKTEAQDLRNQKFCQFLIRKLLKASGFGLLSE